MLCSIINNSEKGTTVACSAVKYDDMYGNKYQQKAMVTKFTQRMRIRNKILEDKELTSEREMNTALDPSTGLCYINSSYVYDGK